MSAPPAAVAAAEVRTPVLQAATGDGGPADPLLTPVELNRLRWRCRRGMLENDLILARYLVAHADTLTLSQVAALDRLLALADDALWEVLSGRAEIHDPLVAPVLEVLRNA